MSPTALTTQDEALLKQAISEVGGRSLITIPQIGMVNNMSDIKGMEKGEYYIRRSVETDGQWETKHESIGSNPEVVILLRRYTYSKFVKAQEKLVAWTNELEGFSEADDVHLINNRGEKARLEVSLPYPQFKQYINKNYRNEDGQQTMKFKNVLYVKYGDEFFRMFVSSASVTGIPSGESHGDYKNPQKGSFTAWENTLKAPDPQAYFYRKVKLGSLAVEDKDYYLMTFEDAGMNDDETRNELLGNWHKMKKDLAIIQNAQFKGFLDPKPAQVQVVEDALPTLDAPPVVDPVTGEQLD